MNKGILQIIIVPGRLIYESFYVDLQCTIVTGDSVRIKHE